MKLEWLKDYRELVSTIYRSANAYSQICKSEHLGENIKFSAYEVQILEHIMENESENRNMSWLASDLGLSKSNFSKYVKKLVDKGLVDKYRMTGNSKNIILRISDTGLQEYKIYSEYAKETWFKELFDVLDTLSHEEIEVLQKVIGIWGGWHTKMIDPEEPELIKLEKI